MKKELEVDSIILNYNNEDQLYSLEDVEKKIRGFSEKRTVFEFSDWHIGRLKEAGRIGNSALYQYSRSSICNFRNGRDLTFSELDQNFLTRFEEYHLAKGNSQNSISVIMRTIRALYNKAILEGCARRANYPFRSQLSTKGYSIGKLNTSTLKRALTKEQMKRIVSLELEPYSNSWHARNYFLFSFYNRGINFIDMAFLTPDNIKNNRMVYRRAKTGKPYNIELLEPSQAIIGHYRDVTDGYLFPILFKGRYLSKQAIHNRIHKIRRKVNEGLKEVASLSGITDNLTTYVARHSWATILKRNGISTSIISEGLGHDSEKTTQIYLDSFENMVLDEANKSLLD